VHGSPIITLLVSLTKFSISSAAEPTGYRGHERSSPGRPSMDMGIPPRPMAPTVVPPIVR